LHKKGGVNTFEFLSRKINLVEANHSKKSTKVLEADLKS
jgi:hypothetical protein